MNSKAFKDSIKNNQPDADLSVQLKALWYDAKGDWHTAHSMIDQLTDKTSAHVHAYLHRKEGDTYNADYWYTRAGEKRPSIPLNEEWEKLVEKLG